MKLDPLQQYAKLKQQLEAEKGQLEARLKELNQVLGSETAPSSALQRISAPAATSKPAARRGRKPRAGNAKSLREALVKALSSGSVARKDLVKAVEAVGYKFTTKNPLNSLGSVLYAKNGPIKSKDGKFYVEGGAAAVETRNNGNEAEPAKKKKRRMSVAGRARIAAAAKAMWARRKAGK